MTLMDKRTTTPLSSAGMLTPLRGENTTPYATIDEGTVIEQGIA